MTGYKKHAFVKIRMTWWMSIFVWLTLRFFGEQEDQYCGISFGWSTSSLHWHWYWVKDGKQKAYQVILALDSTERYSLADMYMRWNQQREYFVNHRNVFHYSSSYVFVKESDYWQYWREMTAYYNNGLDRPIPINSDKDLINALVYASYQIPRLLNIAHRTWFNHRDSVITDREHIIKQFEKKATVYYKEMRSFLSDYPVSDICRIIMSCGVH